MYNLCPAFLRRNCEIPRAYSIDPASQMCILLAAINIRIGCTVNDHIRLLGRYFFKDGIEILDRHLLMGDRNDLSVLILFVFFCNRSPKLYIRTGQ